MILMHYENNASDVMNYCIIFLDARGMNNCIISLRTWDELLHYFFSSVVTLN